MVLRESGLVEVYVDFELVQRFNMTYSTRNLFCVDISTDGNYFSLRFLNLKESKPGQAVYELR